MTEDKMVEWHQQLNGCEFEQASGDGEGQGGLVCCCPWGRRVRHNEVTEQRQLDVQNCIFSTVSFLTLVCEFVLWIAHGQVGSFAIHRRGLWSFGAPGAWLISLLKPGAWH